MLAAGGYLPPGISPRQLSRLEAAVPVCPAFRASVQSSGILPAFVSASVRRVGLQRRARSCLPSLCAPRASVFALQGVPQPEGLSGLCRVGGYRGVAGRTNLQGGEGPGAQLVGGVWLRVQ
ncbi:Polyprotein P1234 [Dissostichus eleginoides]|uniref:Polyprotein P1234 n=1 Tax=Dissostichus eleginoides TaxID=100907 RepID=A0AAD9EW63_DISEL|nr:Polyprotein P1234 [Dissostichus eleginoides]